MPNTKHAEKSQSKTRKKCVYYQRNSLSFWWIYTGCFLRKHFFHRKLFPFRSLHLALRLLSSPQSPQQIYKQSRAITNKLFMHQWFLIFNLSLIITLLWIIHYLHREHDWNMNSLRSSCHYFIPTSVKTSIFSRYMQELTKQTQMRSPY